MASDPRINEDEIIRVSITTPKGLIFKIEENHIPANAAQELIRDGEDGQAAILLHNLTGCSITIERRKLTSCLKPTV